MRAIRPSPAARRSSGRDRAPAHRVLRRRRPRGTDGRFPELTEREREVLDLIAAGRSNAPSRATSCSARRRCATTSRTSSPSCRSPTGRRPSCGRARRASAASGRSDGVLGKRCPGLGEPPLVEREHLRKLDLEHDRGAAVRSMDAPHDRELPVAALLGAPQVGEGPRPSRRPSPAPPPPSTTTPSPPSIRWSPWSAPRADSARGSPPSALPRRCRSAAVRPATPPAAA